MKKISLLLVLVATMFSCVKNPITLPNEGVKSDTTRYEIYKEYTLAYNINTKKRDTVNELVKTRILTSFKIGNLTAFRHYIDQESYNKRDDSGIGWLHDGVLLKLNKNNEWTDTLNMKDAVLVKRNSDVIISEAPTGNLSKESNSNIKLFHFKIKQ